MGGAALRSAALTNPEVIRTLNEQFVPVWINVRTTPVPNLHRLDEVLMEASLDDHRRIENLFSMGFFLRTVILTPDGETTLNAQGSSVIGSGMHLATHGSFAYAETWAPDYKAMLKDALERFRFLEENKVVLRP